MGIDLVHDEAEKELMTVNMGLGGFNNEKPFAASGC